MEDIKKRNLKNYIINTVVLVIYSVANILIVIHHEPWMDEAQAWLIARDLNVQGILRQVVYEGTPALWHLMLHILIKLGLGYSYMLYLHVAIAVVCVFLFLFFSPFSNFTKIAFVFSYHMAYEYSIIARNCNITILLLFLICVIYKDRFKRPILYASLIFLLFNTNSHSLFAAGYLLLLYLWESVIENKEKSLKSFLPVIIMALGGIAAFLQILPPEDIGTRVGGTFTPDAFPVAMATAFAIWWMPINTGAIVISAVTLTAVILSYLMKKPKALLFIIFTYGWLFYIFTFTNKGGLRHHGLILIFLIFALWISHYYEEADLKNLSNGFMRRFFVIISNFFDACKITGGKSKKIAIFLLNINLLLSCFSCMTYYYFEYEHSFSGSKEVAEFIIENNYEDYVIAGHCSFRTVSLVPYLPHNTFWYPEFERAGTYVELTDKYFKEKENLTNIKVIERINKNFPDKSKVLLLLSISPLDYPERYGYRLIFDNKKTIFRTEEVYWLYEPLE